MPTTPVHIRFDSALLARLDARAGRLGLTRTALVHMVLSDHMSDVDQYAGLHAARQLPASEPPGAFPRSTIAEQCPHPVARRIGKQCARCGGTVGKR